MFDEAAAGRVGRPLRPHRPLVGALLVGALLLVGAPVLLSIVFGCAAKNLTAYALRRRAGIPQVTLWQRRRHTRR